MNVSVVIPTRGNVDMQPILDSLPPEWEVVVYNNHGEWDEACGCVHVFKGGGRRKWEPNACGTLPDLKVYARYAAITHAGNDIVFTQDDDCVLPTAVFDGLLASYQPGGIVANMSAYHQLHHHDAPMLGFGAMFQRDLPAKSFSRWDDTSSDLFLRTCDVVFSALTPSYCVNVPFEYLPYSSTPDRMSKQAGFAHERQDVLDTAKALL